MKTLPGKSTSLGNTLEVLKLEFNTDFLVDCDVCFIKGKQTLLITLGVSSWLSTETQAEKAYVARKKRSIFLHLRKLYLFVLSVSFEVLNEFFPITGSRMACEMA